MNEIFDLLGLNRVIDNYCLTVTPDTLVSDAIALMLNISYADEDKANCVLVTEECRLVGIFSQDSALRIAASGKDLSSITIAEVMRKEVVSLKQSVSQDIFTALRIMRQYKISHLPIVDEKDNLLGIVEEKSLLQVFLNEHDGIISLLQKQIELERQVSKLEYANADCKQEIEDISAAEAQIKFDANILAHVRDAIIAVDNNNKIIYLNQRAEQQYNIKTSEFIGRSLEEVYEYRWLNPDDKRVAIESVSTQGWWQGENIHIKNNGEKIYVELSVSFLNDNSGDKIGLLAVIRDITQRKQAEEKLHQTEALLDVTTDAILLRSITGEILYWNQSAEKMYGWAAEEALGKPANELLYKEVSSELAEALQEVIDSGAWQGELVKVTKQGSKITLASRLTLVRDEAGNPKSILSVDTDITERKQLESQFLRAQRLESLGTLASGIAHDLNNMLTPILAIAQLLPLKVTDIDESSQEMLAMLEANAKRGANLVKQVLSFARGDEGKHTVLQVKHLLEDIEQFAKGTFPKSIAIEMNLVKDLWTISGDGTQLHQVFMNLVVNARDAMPRGGTLTIEARNKFVDENYAKMNIDATVGSYVVVTITDTGIGISEQIIDRIFDPFFTTKEVGKGTGLGLSTVLSIVKNHGGFIEVSNEIEKGTQFKVYLPSIEKSACMISENKWLPRGNKELILVVDDEVGICEILKTTLETFNFRVMTAKDGIEAIALYVQHKNEINIVLIDMMMPSMDGATAIRTLQQMNPQVKVIAMSGLVSSEALAQSSGTSIQGFLNKPFSAGELLNILQQVKS